MENLLLHVCCAPCSTAVIEKLKDNYCLTLFFYNPNIHPFEEYEKRLSEAKRIAEKLKLPIIVGEYDKEKWLKAVEGFEADIEGGRRCEICFKQRLQKTAECAEKSGFGLFATTLTISPHKNAETINRIGKGFSGKFLEADFKKKDGFKRSIELSKQHNLYRQTYCGCIFSLKRSIASPKE